MPLPSVSTQPSPGPGRVTWPEGFCLKGWWCPGPPEPGTRHLHFFHGAQNLPGHRHSCSPKAWPATPDGAYGDGCLEGPSWWGQLRVHLQGSDPNPNRSANSHLVACWETSPPPPPTSQAWDRAFLWPASSWAEENAVKQIRKPRGIHGPSLPPALGSPWLNAPSLSSQRSWLCS